MPEGFEDSRLWGMQPVFARLVSVFCFSTRALAFTITFTHSVSLPHSVRSCLRAWRLERGVWPWVGCGFAVRFAGGHRVLEVPWKAL